MKKFILLSFLFSIFSFCLRAQELKKSKWILGPSVGYQHQKSNFLKASVWALTDLGYANYLKLDAGANLTCRDKKTIALPELGITYYLSAKGIWPFVKTEINTNTITPKLGVGVFNILEVGFGYGFDIKEHYMLGEIKGANFSIGLSLPLNYHLY